MVSKQIWESYKKNNFLKYKVVCVCPIPPTPTLFLKNGDGKGLAVNQSVEQTIFIDIGGNNLKCSRQEMLFSFSYFLGFFFTQK